MLLISLFPTSGIFSRVNCLYLFVEDIHQTKNFFIYLYCGKQEHLMHSRLLAVSAESLENSDDHKYFHY